MQLHTIVTDERFDPLQCITPFALEAYLPTFWNNLTADDTTFFRHFSSSFFAITKTAQAEKPIIIPMNTPIRKLATIIRLHPVLLHVPVPVQV